MFKNYLKILLILLLLPMFANASKHKHEIKLPELLVYIKPTCGCCKKWVSHIKNEGIKTNYRSCHTAVTPTGLTFKGHVPAKFIQQFLSEKYSNAIGLSVPTMSVASPSMEVGDSFIPYNVLILFKDGMRKMYAKVKAYEEKF